MTSTAWSPCRRHPCSAEHASLVSSFRDAARTWNAAAEVATLGYATEMAEYQQSYPRPQFREWLVQQRREHDAAESE